MAVKRNALVAKRSGRTVSPSPYQHAANVSSSTQPSIFCFDPKLAGPLSRWDAHLDRAAGLGFTHALFESPGAIDATPSSNFNDSLPAFVQLCAARRLKPLADIKIGGSASSPSLRCSRDGVLAPRISQSINLDRSTDPALPEDLIAISRSMVDQLIAAGLSGIRCQSSFPLPLRIWHSIVRDRDLPADWISIGWLFSLQRSEKIAALAAFDFIPSSTAWWDGSSSWLVEEYNDLRPHGRLLAFPHDSLIRKRSPIDPQERLAECSFRVATSAMLADGWLMPMAYEHGVINSDLRVYTAPKDFEQLVESSPIDLTQQIIEANRQQKMLANTASYMRQIAHEPHMTTIHRPDRDGPGHMIAINAGNRVTDADLRQSSARIGATIATAPRLAIEPHSLLVLELRPTAPVVQPDAEAPSVDAAIASPRIAIEKITPTAEDGKYPVKRIVGDIVSVEADIFSDGHEVLAAELTWKPGDDATIERAPMRFVQNDRWIAEFPLLRPGRHSFVIEAWLDRFGSLRRDLEKKFSAGVEISQEVAEGRRLIEAAIKRSKGRLAAGLRAQLKKLDKTDPVTVLLSTDLLQAMQEADDRPFATGRERSFAVDADREAAAFASWYELFPRSMSGRAEQHGTFRDVIARLPAIRAMGFDVLYFPPIHPIGRRNRKGRNNALTAAPGDPGSPYAIGSGEGGHEAIHPELGTFEDFQALVRKARETGLEIALDFAIQCSPDHPWIKQHPEWFQWRPDGSMKYAENPPKKYEDIVNVDFYAEGAKPSLWLALRDIVQGWVDLGVRTFRVDNPHTKPFPFWEWLIADIRVRDPGVIFLAEAFTRPKIMYRLGKIGFSQSYTYFTWRNTKAEIIEYISELTQPSVADIYRPHFFVNTPDINPYFLQSSGRSGFLIRAAMAATLSGLWGVYSGFELCEAAALPGREEYLDSEKYEIRVRDFDAAGNIIPEITKLNALRNAHAELQSHVYTKFHHAGNDNILYFGKQIAGRPEIVLVAINLDPHAPQSAAVEIPLWDLGLPDDGTASAEDLMTGQRFSLHGKFQTMALTPAMPFAIWKLVPEGRP
ncbi:alpha-1,4-glucan--maltose-1-phosphate maltosyltransferase [Roseiarcaceae bacterium H3SJ34-1]|uniref:alpha-1,4-glucan--maltose-1-phosphate maltosyltransferase n=1 Tax=Terripilifer ovatus TaxID=3032367 RepID=UPI003AB939E1|nr:alpha-1,4-glucan--maltose-1-phosphate maltosyltransferase [Roseiarcaceae bacterium H3SJ34-1]